MTTNERERPPAARVIFVDFGGVVSTDESWHSLRQDGHPLKARLDAG